MERRDLEVEIRVDILVEVDPTQFDLLHHGSPRKELRN
jgi:hypothetical protein